MCGGGGGERGVIILAPIFAGSFSTLAVQIIYFFIFTHEISKFFKSVAVSLFS